MGGVIVDNGFVLRVRPVAAPKCVVGRQDLYEARHMRREVEPGSVAGGELYVEILFVVEVRYGAGKGITLGICVRGKAEVVHDNPQTLVGKMCDMGRQSITLQMHLEMQIVFPQLSQEVLHLRRLQVGNRSTSNKVPPDTANAAGLQTVKLRIAHIKRHNRNP